ncbi:MAG: hypothetical protein LBU30_00175 [Candidatus Methanoplasma sp.]|jgi:hypothetical protein|nr:hypothetical protein [Candidatus Methanoplasma sp.]
MRNKTYTLEMPVRYRELSEDEMEYDGGWNPLAMISTAISITLNVASSLDPNNDLLRKAAIASTVVSSVISFGASSAVIAGVTKFAVNTTAKTATAATKEVSMAYVSLGYSLTAGPIISSNSIVKGITGTGFLW